MNAPEKISLPDIQSQVDVRNMRINAVGIESLRCPMTVATRHGPLATVATCAMTVGLPATAKGTHMSRFVALLEAETAPLTLGGLRRLTHRMLALLDARSGTIELAFPYFVTKKAPVSGVASRLDCDVRWRASIDEGGPCTVRTAVTVPVTSLCPCSKEISAYGAHNQRSHVTIDAEIEGDIDVETLVAIAESSASCEVYGLLKRADEKYVTERAYDNPKFVEDVVRDAALALDREPRVRAYVVEARNFESIHNHSAYACIRRTAEQRP